MKLFAIGDLHLSGGQNKPMDIFGERWADHAERIFSFWRETVSDEDCVLLPGDFCWAMQLGDAMLPINELAELPGIKVLSRGNHDYWWASPTKMREVFPKGVKIIQNDALDMGKFIVCGTRGWTLPGSSDYTQKDEKIFRRELLRLEMSLNSALRFKEREWVEDKPIVVMLHFPPLLINGEDTGFTEVLEHFPVSRVVYGHLHAQSCKLGFEGARNGIVYDLCSADHIDFSPKLIEEYR
ncbi:MAG: metallophosphoesterase [Clostridia bacterium]|nr:metallophosphoesterase [Clostridia bacterium]